LRSTVVLYCVQYISDERGEKYQNWLEFG